MAGAIASVAAQFVMGGRRTRDPSSQWVLLGKVVELPDGEPVRRYVTVTRDAGWAVDGQEHAIWVLRDGGSVSAWSAECPHEGCPIVRMNNLTGFECKCHGSSWGLDGGRQGGPTPRAMDELAVDVLGDDVRVLPQRFKPGVPDRIDIG